MIVRALKYSLIITTILFSNIILAQDKKVIQFSGVVVTDDSLMAVPYASVLVTNKGIGTITDNYGYFSFPAEEGDSIMFSAVGFKKTQFIIPVNMEETHYSMVHVMSTDTVVLGETVVYPWPSKEKFKEAFLNLNIPDDDIERARKNLSPEVLAEKMETVPTSGSLTFKWQMKQHNDQLYYAGQAPPIQIFNPFAWAQFIDAWKNGDFKRKKKNK